jgi:hypothetical protein
MWQFQWMVGLIPDEMLSLIYWIIIAAGITGLIAGWLGKWVPFYGKYAGVLKPIGIILLALGVWLRGGYDTEMAWRDKVNKLEEQVKVAEEKANNKTVEIQKVIVEKTKVIREKGKTQIQYVDRVVTQDKEVIKFIENCPIPRVIIEEHNKATIPPESVKELNKAAESKK